MAMGNNRLPPFYARGKKNMPESSTSEVSRIRGRLPFHTRAPGLTFRDSFF